MILREFKEGMTSSDLLEMIHALSKILLEYGNNECEIICTPRVRHLVIDGFRTFALSTYTEIDPEVFTIQTIYGQKLPFKIDEQLGNSLFIYPIKESKGEPAYGEIRGINL